MGNLVSVKSFQVLFSSQFSPKVGQKDKKKLGEPPQDLLETQKVGLMGAKSYYVFLTTFACFGYRTMVIIDIDQILNSNH